MTTAIILLAVTQVALGVSVLLLAIRMRRAAPRWHPVRQAPRPTSRPDGFFPPRYGGYRLDPDAQPRPPRANPPKPPPGPGGGSKGRPHA